MNFTHQLKFILIIAFFALIGTTTSNAQCRFSSQLERLEYIALKAIYNSNPDNTLSNEWKQLANGQSCDVCRIPETYCDVYGQLKGLSIGRKNISKLPREIAALSELQFFDLQNNNLTCLPIEADALCSADPFGEVLKGNPIHELINWMDFCTYPRDICLPNLNPPSACDDLAIFNYLDTVYLLGLGESYNKVEVIGAPTNWKVFEICTYCTNFQLISDLPEGDYTLKINISTPNGGHCYREEKISISKNGNPTTPAPPSTKVEYIGAGTNWRVKTFCDGDCFAEERIFDLPEGNYKVKINQRGVDEKYCYREELVQVLRGSSNRNSLAHQENLVVYPNPAKDQLTLTMNNLDESTQIRIYNALGHLVKTVPKQPIGNNINIDLTGFENRLYLLSIFQNGSKVITRRFLVEHLR